MNDNKQYIKIQEMGYIAKYKSMTYNNPSKFKDELYDAVFFDILDETDNKFVRRAVYYNTDSKKLVDVDNEFMKLIEDTKAGKNNGLFTGLSSIFINDNMKLYPTKESKLI